MGRSSRSSKTAGRADRHAEELSRKLGRMLKDARLAAAMTQVEAARRAGVAQSTWSRLELSGDSRVSIGTWDRAGLAVGASLDAFLRRTSAADQPRDAVHLRNQELVIRTALSGGWRSLPEHPIDREVRSSRAADVLLQRGHEYALCDVWDWFADVGAAERAWHRRLDAVERYAIARMTDEELPRVAGFWVVRATVRNRQLFQEHRHFFGAVFPGSPTDWLAALSSPAWPMPRDSALVWASVKGDRLFAALPGGR